MKTKHQNFNIGVPGSFSFPIYGYYMDEIGLRAYHSSLHPAAKYEILPIDNPFSKEELKK